MPTPTVPVDGAQSPLSRLMEVVAAETGAVVNLHDVAGITLHAPDLRLKPDQHLHHGGFCRFIKLHGRNIRCSENKRRSVAIATERERPFAGTCPFGVWDMACPVHHEGRLQAIIYLGHFRTDRPLETVDGRAWSGPDLPRITPDVRTLLRRRGGMLAETVKLLLVEWLRGGGDTRRTREVDFYRQATERFLEAHYTEPVRLQDFADQLRVHPNHLGKVVQRCFGRSFGELLRDRRIAQAKLMLTVSTSTISEVAFACGFQDSNYFSTMFSAAVSCPPREYRRQTGSCTR